MHRNHHNHLVEVVVGSGSRMALSVVEVHCSSEVAHTKVAAGSYSFAAVDSLDCTTAGRVVEDYRIVGSRRVADGRSQRQDTRRTLR